jgi:hypothetical protein
MYLVHRERHYHTHNLQVCVNGYPIKPVMRPYMTGGSSSRVHFNVKQLNSAQTFNLEILLGHSSKKDIILFKNYTKLCNKINNFPEMGGLEVHPNSLKTKQKQAGWTLRIILSKFVFLILDVMWMSCVYLMQ